MEGRPVAFITGASRGIGRAICIELARCGFDIVGNATSYNPDDTNAGLAAVRETVTALGAAFEPAPGDIADLDVHQHLLDAAIHRFNRLDLLVNNAGVAPHPRLDVLETTPGSFDRVLSINTRGTFFLTQRFARRMIEQRRDDPTARPAITFITSISAVVASPSRAEYCASKAAISQLAHVFADRLARFGINVYEIRPGIIRTDMTTPVRGMYDEKIAAGLIPQQRWGEPEDVARAVAALARGDLAYSTGAIIEVSGGMNVRRV